MARRESGGELVREKGWERIEVSISKGLRRLLYIDVPPRVARNPP